MPRKKKNKAPVLPSITREALEARKTEDGRIPIDDVVIASVLCMFVVQKLGKASAAEIQGQIEELAGAIDPFLCAQAIEALQARGLVSYATGRSQGSGESVRMWKPRSIIWARPPEVAHLTELLPALVATDEAADLIATLNAGEAEGEGEKKATRKLGYDEYIEVEAEFLTIDELLGSQPESPHLDNLVKASRYNGVKADLRFWRASTGELLIPSDAIRGWLRTGIRTEGYSDATAQYIAPTPARIAPTQKLTQTALPVVDPKTGAGKGLITYETVQPGERFTIRFRLPVRGFMTANQFRVWLASYGPNPLRGISPARGGRFGKVALVGFRELGETKSGAAMLEAVMDEVPEEAREYYSSMMDELRTRDLPLRKGVTKDVR